MQLNYALVCSFRMETKVYNDKIDILTVTCDLYFHFLSTEAEEINLEMELLSSL